MGDEPVEYTTIPNWQDALEGGTNEDGEEEAVVDPLSDPLGSADLPPPKFPVDESINKSLALWVGGVWRLNTDAIVNATEEYYTDKRGTSEMIFRVAGPMLEQEVSQVALESNPSNNPIGCRTGDAIVTNGYNLPAAKVIHTVGPRFNEKYRTAAENMLHSCYRACLQALVEQKLNTIAFSCIHSERKHYEPGDAVPIVLRTIRRFLERFPTRIGRIVLAIPPHYYDVYFEQMQLYFPRNKAEEIAAQMKLPDDVGNEIGETVTAERKIRIDSMPTNGPVAKPASSVAPSSISTGGRRRGDPIVQSGPAIQPSIEEDGLDKQAIVNKNDNFFRVTPIASATGVSNLASDAFSAMQTDVDSVKKKSKERDPNSEMEQMYQRYLKKAQTDNLGDVESWKAIYKAGLDVHKRPVLVLVGARVPNKHAYERLLLAFIKHIDKLGDAEYSVTYFHSNTKHKPELGWLRKVYKMLPYKSKKNLKALYIVHPTVWLNIAYGFMKPFVSSKLKAKLHIIDRLDTLYSYIPAEQINVPEEVARCEAGKKGNKPKEKKKTIHEEL